MATTFISHSSRDFGFTDKIVRKFRENKISVWLAERDMYLGDSLVSKIAKGIGWSDYFLVIVSDNSVSSPWVKAEIEHAMSLYSKSKISSIYPLLFGGEKDCIRKIHPALESNKYTDFRDPNKFDEGFSEILKSINDSSPNVKKWVRVVGKGDLGGKWIDLCSINPSIYWMAKKIGRKIAQKGWGLIVGGWNGVDYVVSQEFSAELNRQEKNLFDYMTQLVLKGNEPVFKGGRIINFEYTKEGFIESVKNADAVVLIGGEGATWDIYRCAIEEWTPVFPLNGTGGDAHKAYEDMLHNRDSNYRAHAVIQKDSFESILGANIKNEQEADKIAEKLIGLISTSQVLV
jgi:hypothetical protein